MTTRKSTNFAQCQRVGVEVMYNVCINFSFFGSEWDYVQEKVIRVGNRV